MASLHRVKREIDRAQNYARQLKEPVSNERVTGVKRRAQLRQVFSGRKETISERFRSKHAMKNKKGRVITKEKHRCKESVAINGARWGLAVKL